MKILFLFLTTCFLMTSSSKVDVQKAKNEKLYVHYTKVGYQANTKMIKYFYQSGKQKRILIFQLKGQIASIQISDGKKVLYTITGNGKNIQWQKGDSSKKILLKEAYQLMDKYSRAILLNHPIIRGEFELRQLYDDKYDIKSGESEYIRKLSDDTVGGSAPGTVTASCSCGNTTITITCDTTCGAGCELANRRRCRYGPSGEETDCETKEYCVGYCACGR